MIDALIGGKISGAPAKRTGPSGKPFVVAKVRTPTGQGETIFINVIAFDEAVGDALVALSDGDSVALSGAMTPKVWTPANGAPRGVMDLIAHSITSSYHIQRKRQAAQAPGQSVGMG